MWIAFLDEPFLVEIDEGYTVPAGQFHIAQFGKTVTRGIGIGAGTLADNDLYATDLIFQIADDCCNKFNGRRNRRRQSLHEVGFNEHRSAVEFGRKSGALTEQGDALLPVILKGNDKDPAFLLLLQHFGPKEFS